MRQLREHVLFEAMSQPPVAANQPMIAGMDAAETERYSQVQGHLDEATQAVNAKARIRLEAEKLLRDAMGIKKNALNGIGEPPNPSKMVAREVFYNPDLYATAWRLFAKELTTLHCLRFRPSRASFVTDDPGLSCDVLAKLDARNARTLAG
jgi:hypothetical protein